MGKAERELVMLVAPGVMEGGLRSVGEASSEHEVRFGRFVVMVVM